MEEKEKRTVEDSSPVDVDVGTAADVEAVMKKYDRESNTKIWEGLPKQVIRYAMALFMIFMVYVSMFSSMDGSVRRCWFLGLILVFVYIMYPIKKGAVTRVNYMPWYDIVLAVLSIGTFGYQIYFLDDLIYKGSRLDTIDIIIGTLAILLLIEACRRVVGIPIIVVVVAFMAYALLGSGMEFKDLIYTLFYTTQGILGTPIQVCSTYIFLFVLFGAFPYHWEIGAVAVNTLNIVICAYCWYVIIAFTSFGTRDPYVYAMGGWVICFGSRSLARMLLYFTYPLAGNDLLINSLLGALVLISTQVVLVQFMHAERGESSAENDRLEAENERVKRQAEADAAESAAALAEAAQTLQDVVFNAAKREASAQQTASEALKAAEARQCIRCNEECAAIREQLLQIDPSSISLASAPSSSPSATMPSPLASSASVALEPSPIPSPLSMGELSDSMRRNVERMGEHFLLTSREMDVLTLYALGHTQKKVAEELFITPATAHSHIKRIYSKCGMHSRQEILEYLNSYGS